MTKKLKAVLYGILPFLMIVLCASMITYIFAATKSELLITGKIGYEVQRGTGTEEDPFLITSVGPNDGTATKGTFNFYAGNNATNTNYFASTSPQYYFKQANDITGSDFTQTTLLGFYDGNGYGFDASGSNKAIFSAIGSSSVTTSKLEDLDVKNTNSTASAGVVVNLYGTLDNITFEGSITNSSSTYIGGLVSTSTGGRILNSVNHANITTNSSSIGGIVGNMQNGYLYECANFGTLKGNATSSSSVVYMGGIVANLVVQSSSVENCFNFGEVNTVVQTSSSRYSGGIAGYAHSIASSSDIGIVNCGNYGNIGSSTFWETYSGGIVGFSSATRVMSCFNIGNVCGQAYAGGIAGGVVGFISNCYNTGTIASGSSGKLGGIAGAVDSSVGASITYSYNVGKTTTGLASYIGGIIGYVASGSTSTSYYLNTCGASVASNGSDVSTTSSSKSLSQMQTQSTYENWTFGEYGSATSGWCFVASEILVDGEYQNLLLPRLWWEDLEVLNTYSITYNANGGTGSIDVQNVIIGESVILSSSGLTAPSGKSFAGWATSASGSVVYADGDSFIPSGNVTLYAVWETITYTITFNANGGSGSMTAQTFSHGVSQTLSSNSFTRTGYDFLGWSTSSTATSATYSNGQSITISSSITLYAVWRIKTYTITFNANGGSFGGNGTYTVSSVSGASYGFSLNSSGYYESQNKGVANSAALCKVTFYATAGSTVTFTVINYGESSFDYGMLGTLDGTAMSTSYSDVSTGVAKSFSGSQSASTQTYSYSISSTGNHTVYVKYRKDGSVDSNNDSFQFKITSGLGGATTQTMSVTHGSTISSLPTPTRSGYTFNGWYTATSGGTKITTSTQMTATKTYYAQWSAPTYSVSVSKHSSSPSSGCSYSVNKSSVTSGTSVTFTATMSSGYTFQGWYTSSSSTSSSYRKSTSTSYTMSITSNTTLYAYWTQNASYDCICSSCTTSVSSSGSYCSSCSYCSCCGGCWNHCSCTSSRCSTCGECINCCPYGGSHSGGGGGSSSDECACNSCSNPVSGGGYCSTCAGDYIYCSNCGICSYHGYDYCNVAIHDGYLTLCEGCCPGC